MESQEESAELLRLRTSSSVKTLLESRSLGMAVMGLLAAMRRWRPGKAELSLAISSQRSILLSLKWRWRTALCWKSSARFTVP